MNRQAADVVSAIAAGKPHIATGEEGYTVMRLLDAIYKSAAKGGPVIISERTG